MLKSDIGPRKKLPKMLFLSAVYQSATKNSCFSIEFILECALAEYLTYTQLFRIYFAHFYFEIYIVKYILLITVYIIIIVCVIDFLCE